MDRDRTDGELVPVGLRAAAGWTWRLMVIGAGIYLLLRLMGIFEVLVVPVLLALLVVALLKPLVRILREHARMPRALASLLAILAALAVIVGLITLIGQQISSGFGDLQTQALAGWRQVQQRLAASPLHLTNNQLSSVVDDALNNASKTLRGNSSKLVSGVVEVGSTAADVVTGFFVVLFSTFFFLSGGDHIWAWVVRLFPLAARARVDAAGVRAWATLTAYVRATVLVALVDGTGVGVVAAVIGVPLAIPLGVLVFLGAFVPVVGAFVSGIVAVLVALVAKGPVIAAIMLAGVVSVQQVEAHVLQPFLMGRAVRVHPLAVILAIGAGAITAGIVGALFAVPLTAVIKVVGEYLSGERDEIEEEGPLADLPADDLPVADRPVAGPAADSPADETPAAEIS